ncbi:trimeric intracellular cation channel family protein [Kocuria sp. cx-116]|uniref:trimeric intracellular cation channel family protein n=1 Tax=Kocuria sp. cx-116 TaxID=2771378 RepID=UPI0016880195|nr:trimeric intracellular cation channel family protein [Kocuria sp. cx-116]MBD2761772.1 trimeric intracellular cation channel family protein [Kocuria sp. cx-116]
MNAAATVHLILDLTGTFAFGLNGALTAVRAARVDIVGVVTLGMITALGGGIIRDMLLDDLPPATFRDWRYLVTAAAGALIAFALGRHLHRLAGLITVLDTVGLSVFAVSGANKALEFDIGVGQAVILGTITAVGGGTLRDVLIGQIPTVLRTGFYAVPALVGATVTVVASGFGVHGLAVAIAAAAVCFLIRMLGLRFRIDAPHPPGTSGQSEPPEQT